MSDLLSVSSSCGKRRPGKLMIWDSQVCVSRAARHMSAQAACANGEPRQCPALAWADTGQASLGCLLLCNKDVLLGIPWQHYNLKQHTTCLRIYWWNAVKEQLLAPTMYLPLRRAEVRSRRESSLWFWFHIKMFYCGFISCPGIYSWITHHSAS